MGRPREISDEQRARLMERGFRPIEVWVPDAQNPAYLAEAARQARSSVAADAEDDVTEWAEGVSSNDWDKA